MKARRVGCWPLDVQACTLVWTLMLWAHTWTHEHTFLSLTHTHTQVRLNGSAYSSKRAGGHCLHGKSQAACQAPTSGMSHPRGGHSSSANEKNEILGIITHWNLFYPGPFVVTVQNPKPKGQRFFCLPSLLSFCPGMVGATMLKPQLRQTSTLTTATF